MSAFPGWEHPKLPFSESQPFLCESVVRAVSSWLLLVVAETSAPCAPLFDSRAPHSRQHEKRVKTLYLIFAMQRIYSAEYHRHDETKQARRSGGHRTRLTHSTAHTTAHPGHLGYR